MSTYIVKDSGKVFTKSKKKTKKGSIHLFIPPLLQVKNLSIALTGVRNGYTKSTSVALLYTYLFKNTLFHGDRDTERWVQVDRRSMRTMLGEDYTQVLDTLLEAKLLERLEHNEDGVVHKHNRGHYWNSQVHGTTVGECKKYRIPAHLLSDKKLYTKVIEPATDNLLRKIDALTEPVVAIREQYREMALFNMSDIVLLDCPGSRAVLDQLYAQGNIQLTAGDYLDLINHFPLEVPVVCDFGHRAHHRIVRLHHSLRPWLRFKDDQDSPLVEIDIVASQPTILANITPRLIKKYAPECAAAIPLFEKYSQEPDYKRYQEFCFKGEIYEHLRDEYNNVYASQWVNTATRDDAKKMVFVAFFSNYVYREQAAPATTTENILIKYLAADNQEQADATAETLFKKNAYELFKRLFPSLHALFMEIKALTWDFNPGQQHSNNCLVAQRVESGLIYSRFVKALVEAGITRFTTTHDAINVKKQDEVKARKIILAEIKKAGLKMKLKTKEVEKPVVESTPEIQSQPAPFEPVILFDPLLDVYEEPVVAAAPPAAPATPSAGLSDDEIARRQVEIEAVLPSISAEEFFGF